MVALLLNLAGIEHALTLTVVPPKAPINKDLRRRVTTVTSSRGEAGP